MSNTTSITTIQAAELATQIDPDADLLAASAVRVLWEFRPSWSFDEIIQRIGPIMDPDLVQLLRSEAPPSVEGPAARALLNWKPPLGQMTLLTNDQFERFQRSIARALALINLGPHRASVDELDELTHVRHDGDFIAIIA